MILNGSHEGGAVEQIVPIEGGRPGMIGFIPNV